MMEAQERYRVKALEKQKTGTAKPKRQASKLSNKTPLKSKGMKGRSRTAEEKLLESKIAAIGCICCLNQGWYTSAMQAEEHQRYISLHHVDGRTKPWCHAKQLPLCQHHHDTVPGAGAPETLFPIHGGGRQRWEAVNGTEEALLKQVYDMIGEKRPWLDES
ncbi:MAG: recombination enhancement function protein [Gammaproteobacteria bacterium]|nr:recombination enhancement function protein [Gammaproteobacteria bacterium]